MSPTFQLTNFTKKEFLSFDGLYAGYGGGLGTGGTALELLYSAQTLLLLDDKLYAHHYAIEDWRPHKQGLPAEFQAAIKQLSGRWAGGDKIGFVERSDWEMRYNGEESAASVKARAEHTLQSTFEDTRMNGQMTMDTLKNEPDFYPKNKLLMAQAHARLGRKEEARYWLQSCLRSTPKTPEDEQTLAEAARTRL